MSRVGHCQRQRQPLPLPLPLCHMLRRYITWNLIHIMRDYFLTKEGLAYYDLHLEKDDLERVCKIDLFI